MNKRRRSNRRGRSKGRVGKVVGGEEEREARREGVGGGERRIRGR